MVNQASEIVQQILSLESSYSTTLVAIDGKGGAGKSTLANHLGLPVGNDRAARRYCALRRFLPTVVAPNER